MALEHPDRDRAQGWTLPRTYNQLKADARGTPMGYNESILYGDAQDHDRLRGWYGAKGWTTDLDKYLQWYGVCRQSVDYFIIHDEKGMQCDVNWPRPLTGLEDALGGEPPPPPEPPEPDFTHIVKLAYVDILRREADDGGLKYYCQRMVDGMTESMLRETLLRSDEFKRRYYR
jgi:hypothetical protein